MKKYELHKQTKTKEYNIWRNIIQRCTNPKSQDYKYYGGRGIIVCKDWKESFLTFFNDMGKCPVNKSLDRIDNEKGYSKENCRWATKDEQMQNTRKTNLITYNNITMGLTAWSRKLGINKESLRIRLIKMTVEEAFTKPVKKDKRRSTINLNKV